MGSVGREIVGDAAEEIIELLNKGAAAELNDAYRYMVLAKLAEGIHSTDVAEFFAQTAQDEWGHLATLTERAVQLGGRPMASPQDSIGLSYADYREPPKNPADLRAMLEDSLEGERAAIRFYKGLYDRTLQADPITAEIARQALVDEVNDEQDLERLLVGWDELK
jgi:ferritin-like protein